MAATGYTPISLYYSTTASAVPTAGNLANGELALNIADMKLYAKNSSGTVTLLASNASTTGVDSLSFGSTGLTPNTATTGAITVAGTLNVANGGTGLTSLTANRIPYGNGTSAFQSSAGLTFDGTTIGWSATNLILNATSTASSALFRVQGSTGDQWQFGAGINLAGDWGVTNNTRSINPIVISGGTTSPTLTFGGSLTYMTASSTGLAITGTVTSTNYGTFRNLRIGVDGSNDIFNSSAANTYYSTSGSSYGHVFGNSSAQTYCTLSYTALIFNTNNSERFRVGPSGQWGIGGANYGTSGQVLTSAGSGAAPTWSTVSAGSKAADTQTFNSSGTWTKPSGFGTSARVFIQVWGGGGGGADSIGGNQGGGGGGGAYNERWLPLSSLGSTETATVGAGGTRGTTAPGGGTGGTTSLGTLVYAYGGGGGAGSNCNSAQSGGGGGGQMSAGSRGDVSNSSTPYSGRPWLNTVPKDSSGNAVSLSSFGEYTGAVQGNRATEGRYFDAFWHGGGGGSRHNTTTGAGLGGNSVAGGGGGGAGGLAGGTSQTGGAGGASPAGAGTAPAGGGGGGTSFSNIVGGAGAAGRIIVTVFDGA